jgi:4'-phosphopantetheinyl transferase
VSNLQTIPENVSLNTDEKITSVGLSGLLSCRLHLTPADVHLWQAKLDKRLADSVERHLSTDEIYRAGRFHFVKDRDHYVAARGLLRTLLSVYLGIRSDKLRFSYAEKGKPSLEESHESAINFNLAHSHGMAVYAFSPSREVGIDLEYMREDLASEDIAERFFSRREIKMLAGVPAELRTQSFFNCWTRKEAYIKARGEGLSMSLDEFDVSLEPGEPAALLANHKEPAEVTRWSMQSISVPAGYVAALCVAGFDWRLKSFALESGTRE